ncbi:hypothetical protein CHS0354_030829 [Potamilus streckersoni]|uniref:Uncharacterized protein n=1 Tax=Potamilus streckersoni TaxID=2493646 RepID=A0AAE0TDG3_9BIVA|nr:hypothetical protein CHS0354_030829 [Potamilus streckersoni]
MEKATRLENLLKRSTVMKAIAGGDIYSMGTYCTSSLIHRVGSPQEELRLDCGSANEKSCVTNKTVAAGSDVAKMASVGFSPVNYVTSPFGAAKKNDRIHLVLSIAATLTVLAEKKHLQEVLVSQQLLG